MWKRGSELRIEFSVCVRTHHASAASGYVFQRSSPLSKITDDLIQIHNIHAVTVVGKILVNASEPVFVDPLNRYSICITPPSEACGGLLRFGG